jgi:hypothetical protein
MTSAGCATVVTGWGAWHRSFVTLGGSPRAFDTCYVALPRCRVHWDCMEVGHSCALLVTFCVLGVPRMLSRAAVTFRVARISSRYYFEYSTDTPTI